MIMLNLQTQLTYLRRDLSNYLFPIKNRIRNSKFYFINHFYFNYYFYELLISLSSCISETACLISCEISLFVTAANREGILQLTRVWRLSLGGTGGESVNSAGYSLIE